MTTAAVLAAVLIQAAPAPDVSWMAGYWLDCSGGREVSETWSDPRNGLSVGHAVTVTARGVSFEVSHVGPTPQGFAYVAQPGGAPPTAPGGATSSSGAPPGPDGAPLPPAGRAGRGPSG